MATVNTPSTYLSSLVSAGPDAMTNLFYVELSSNTLNNNELLKTGLRVRNRDFNFTELTHATQTVNYMTVSLDIPSASLEGSKTFSLTFRVDANYDVYKYLLKQMARTSAPNLGYASNDVPDEAGEGGLTIRVYAIDKPLTSSNHVDPEGDNFTLMYEFTHCWIENLAGLNYSYNSPDAETVTVTFGFWEYKNPQSLLLNSDSE